MTFTYRPNRVAEARERLISQYKEKPNFVALMEVFAEQSQEIEDNLNLIAGVGLNSATGNLLDLRGAILGIKRLGRTDPVYRTRLYAAIIQYTSSGRWKQLTEGFKLLTGARVTQGGEIFPAAVELMAVGAENLSAVDLTEVAAALQQLKAAGVRLGAALVVAEPPFVFGGDPDIKGQGFADINNYETTGGYFPLKLSF